MGKVKVIYGISTMQGGIVFEYPTRQGNMKKAMFATANASQKAIDEYLQDQYINDFIVCTLGDRVTLLKEED